MTPVPLLETRHLLQIISPGALRFKHWLQSLCLKTILCRSQALETFPSLDNWSWPKLVCSLKAHYPKLTFNVADWARDRSNACTDLSIVFSMGHGLVRNGLVSNITDLPPASVQRDRRFQAHLQCSAKHVPVA